MKTLLLILLCPAFLFALTDQDRIDSAQVAVNTQVQAAIFLKSTLCMTVLKSLNHPEWVRLDFPLTATTGIAKRRVEQAIIDIIAAGAEPAYRDSTVRGGYVRMLVPGRVQVHNSTAQQVLIRFSEQGIVIGDTSGAAVRDTCDDGGWRLLLKKLKPGQF